MSKQFAQGKQSVAFCDRCDRKIKYLDLKKDVYDKKPTGLLVCSECQDKDHEQLRIKDIRVQDPQNLKDPRPDKTPYEPVPSGDQDALDAFINSYTTGT